MNGFAPPIEGLSLGRDALIYGVKSPRGLMPRETDLNVGDTWRPPGYCAVSGSALLPVAGKAVAVGPLPYKSMVKWSIEAEGELVQVLPADRTLVRAQEPPLQQRGHQMDSRQQL